MEGRKKEEAYIELFLELCALIPPDIEFIPGSTHTHTGIILSGTSLLLKCLAVPSRPYSITSPGKPALSFP